jgi:D-amino-acid dehydrogenase
VVSRDELLKIEPAFKPFAHRIVGGTFTDTDESGDARLFTQGWPSLCAQRGVQFLYGHAATARGGEQPGPRRACGPARCAARPAGRPAAEGRRHRGGLRLVQRPLLRQVGVRLPIYPGKGYSATFKILKPEAAPWVSAIDDELKVAMSRLGDELRVAGTIELGGYDLDLNGPVARARCEMLARRIEAVMPGVCDTRLEHEGGQPNFWCGLRPATPTNIPFIGQTRPGLWVNAGHGTLGWTHGAGSGKALAELIHGEQPSIADRFGFLGVPARKGAPQAALA